MTKRWFAHANVNTRDMEASRVFYGELGLTPEWATEDTRSPAVGLPGFDGPAARWSGTMFSDVRRRRGPFVDLIGWTEPATLGSPGIFPTTAGFASLIVDIGVEAFDAISSRHAQHLGRAWLTDEERLVTLDPDGVAVELRPSAQAPRFRGVRVVVADLEESSQFYRDVMGLVLTPPADVAFDLDGESRAARSTRANLPGHQDQFFLELTQISGATLGAAPVVAHHAGIYRVALLVDDVVAETRDLRDWPAYGQVAAPVAMELAGGMPTVRPVFFSDPDGAVLELFDIVDD